MSQSAVDAAIRSQLGAMSGFTGAAPLPNAGPNQSTPNRTPEAAVAQMMRTSVQASALNPNAALGGGTPVGPEMLRPAR